MVEVYKREVHTLGLTYEVDVTTDYLLIITEKEKGVYYKPGDEYEIKIVDNPKVELDGEFKTAIKLDERDAKKVLEEIKSRIGATKIRKMEQIENALVSLKNINEIEKTLFL